VAWQYQTTGLHRSEEEKTQPALFKEQPQIRKANYKIPPGSKAVLLFARKKSSFCVFVMILLPSHSGTSVMLMGERLLEGSGLSRAMPTCPQHLPQLPTAVGWVASTAAWSWVGAGEKSWLTHLQKTWSLQEKKNRFPFSISWENTERRDKPIYMCYPIARRYVGDLEEELGVT